MTSVPFSIRTDHPAFVAIIAGALYLTFFVGLVARDGFDPRPLVTAGDMFVDASAAAEGFPVIKDSAGYDGQYYYRGALSPFSAAPTVGGVKFDFPRHRQSRILYPLLGWIFSAGQPAAAPWALPLVNLAAVIAVGWFGGFLARQLNLHALWGLIFPLFPGFCLSFARNLTEILAGCFLIGTIVEFQRHRLGRATLYFTLAVFSKETSLGLAPALVAAALMPAHRHWRPRALAVTAIPAALFAAWWLFLKIRWADQAGPAFPHAFGPPFTGFVDLVTDTVTSVGRFRQTTLIELVLMSLFFLSTAIAIRTSRATAAVKIGCGIYAVAMACLSTKVWVEDWAFLRAGSEFFILGGTVLLGSAAAVRWIFAPVSLAAWVALAVHVLLFR